MIGSVNNINPGDLYTKTGRDVWEVESFCQHPTVTLKNVRTGELCGGAVGCRNLAPFVALKPSGPIAPATDEVDPTGEPPFIG